MDFWKNARYRLEWLVFRAMAALIPRLPRAVVLALGRWIGRIAAALDRAGNAVALANLEAAFGDELLPARRQEIVRESYQLFTRSMLDLFWSPRLTAGNFRDFVSVENMERFEQDVGPAKTCIFACFHYGNFEWMSHAFGYMGYTTEIVGQEFKNPLLDSTFNSLRQLSGHRMVAREGAIVRLYKSLKRGGRVAILVDLTLPPTMPSVAIDCFGLKTCVTFAHAWLHERTRAPIFPFHCEPLPDGRYRVVSHPKMEIAPAATHQEIAQACWDSFEPYARANPAPWLWMYKLWRYKPADATRPYPFYANVSIAFEALLERARNDGQRA